MMNRNRIAVAIILFLSGVLAFSVTTITRLDHFRGEDFVQLQLHTGKIIPIPDVFYPEKNNTLILVMRMRDVEFAVDKTSYDFDSPVIAAVNVRKEKEYSDVEIRLKEDVNYRIFSNQDGLCIEFPVVRTLAATSKPAILNSAAPAVSGKGAGNVLPANMGEVRMTDVVLGRADEKGAVVELLLSAKPDFQVIPIQKPPYRLAIDLKNTRSGKIDRTLTAGNVKAIRGSYNSPGTFRVVFDLSTWKEYKVEWRNDRLAVEFFAATPPAAPVISQVASKQTVIPVSTTPATLVPVNATVPVVTPTPVPAVATDKIKLKFSNAEFFSEEKTQAEQDKLQSKSVEEASEEKNGEKVRFSGKYLEAGKKKYLGEPVDFTFKDADLKNILILFAKISGLNFAIDADVSGKITCEFTQVPWDQALEIFLKQNGLDMVQEGNIVRIGKVGKLASEAEERRKMMESREEAGKVEVFTRSLSYAKVGAVKPILDKQLSKRGEIIFDERTNTLIITELPEKIRVIDELIDVLDSPNPQVAIEAKIIEANSNYLDTFGIQWGPNFVIDPRLGNQTTLNFPSTAIVGGMMMRQNTYTVDSLNYGYAVNLPVSDSGMYPFFRLGSANSGFMLDLQLSGMQTKGQGRVISSPRTTTQNNMPAEIEQGEKIPIQTIQNNTITTVYINATLKLKVTPQITARGSIVLNIELENDYANFNKMVLGMPTISTERAKTVVMVPDGGTLVIGGMYKVNTDSTVNNVPLIGRIPVLGNLFRSHAKRGNTFEILIFITPRIIK